VTGNDNRTLPRRQFLLAGAATLAASSPVARAAVRSLESLAASAALPRPGRSGIEHVVVVMMENRSFDHMLGWLPGADGKQSGLKFPDSQGKSVSTYPLAPDFQGCGHVDPDHSYNAGRVQYNNGKCDGFLKASQDDRYAIGYYRQNDLPFLGRAARDWTVCDRYFAALMGSTWANRAYQHAGVTPSVQALHTTLHIPTIWDRLAGRRVRGLYYHSDEPYLDNWGDKYLSITRTYPQFLADCKSGQLPQVAYVDPPRNGDVEGLSSDYHPFGDIRAGEHFLDQTYEAVTKSPNWRSTVLVINFDEWGGFFEHVPPPLAPDVSQALRLRGFRVPCLVISPFARRRHVAHQVFDHTSILRMIEWRWGLEPLSVRDRYARNLATVLDFSRRNLRAPQYNVPNVISKPCKK
jgi:phospholipase C